MREDRGTPAAEIVLRDTFDLYGRRVSWLPRRRVKDFLLGPQQLEVKIPNSDYDLQSSKLSLPKWSIPQAESYLDIELQSQFPNLPPSQWCNTPRHGGKNSVQLQDVIIIDIIQD